MANRESSSALAITTGCKIFSAAGARVTDGTRNAAGISAGRAGFWQQDMEHDMMPPMPLISCPQSIGIEF